MVTRRRLLTGLGALATTSGLTGYATAYEAGTALTVTSYALSPPRWPDTLPLKIAVVADIHACYPWMSEERIGSIVDLANAQKPDLTVVLGDFVCTHPFVSGFVPPGAWAEQLARLQAPLGVYAILGNHDWWFAAIPTDPPDGSRSIRKALAAARIPVLENQSVRLSQNGKPFWLVGLGDQLARSYRRPGVHGVDDLPAAMRDINDDAPAILLAHEPYIFSRVPDRIALTLCGHTHGGQINIPFIGSALMRARLDGKPYIYGAYSEGERRLVVSGGLGTSLAPVRILRPPEVVTIDLAA
ncbi:MAG: metallophosphoesterase [Hyphomicrobiales bacterium]|nr:metallophosphoesterase [Hyphomicrobiales bacterium]